MTCVQIDENDIGTDDSLGLCDILNAVSNIAPGVTCSLLELEARGRLRGDRSVVEFEQQIASSPEGVRLTWPEFTRLAEDLDDVINLLAVGSEVPGRTAGRDPRKLAEVHDIVLERFDSTYWRVYFRRPVHGSSLRSRLSQSRECDSD